MLLEKVKVPAPVNHSMCAISVVTLKLLLKWETVTAHRAELIHIE